MKKKELFSTLWIVLTANYIFCDILTLMHFEDLQKIITGNVDGLVMSQEFLLTFGIIMEVPMAMILLSRILKYRINRVFNVGAAIFMTLVQAGSLFAGSENTLHYMFYSIVEIGLSSYIAYAAYRWREEG